MTFEGGRAYLAIDPATHLVSIGVGKVILEALPTAADFVDFTGAVLGASDLGNSIQSQTATSEH